MNYVTNFRHVPFVTQIIDWYELLVGEFMINYEQKVSSLNNL